MIRFDDALFQAGMDDWLAANPRVVAEFVYTGLKNGKVQTFATLGEVTAFSGNVYEKTWSNEPEVNAWRAAHDEVYAKAVAIWKKALREEHGHLPEKVFDVAYDYAYSDGHSAGYDEVANCMFGAVEYAEKIMEALK